MYKELVLIKNEQNFWNYVFDISKSIHKNISTNNEIIEFVKIEFENLSESNILILDSEVYIVTDTAIECVNCGSEK
jgi:hypothetical protein